MRRLLSLALVVVLGLAVVLIGSRIPIVISVIEPVIARLPERLLEAEHRADMMRIRVEQGQIVMQAAQRALLRSRGRTV